MASHEEIEVKLRVDPEKLTKFRRSSWWRQLEKGSRESLRSVYFDTSNWQLREDGISLRTRTNGRNIVQTVKLQSDAAGSLSRREWEATVPDPIPDPSLVIDPALPPSFRKLTSADLHSVFDVDVKRETRRLTLNRTKIDVSIDSGAVIAGDRRQPLHEIELELVAGELADVFAEVRRLSDAVEGRIHARTKADLGYMLARGHGELWSRASKLDLTPDMSAGESFQFVVRNSFAHLTANDDCARLNLQVEGVHQCRVALRRLRSGFKIYRHLLRRKSIANIEDGVRWLGKILGAARDLDVLQTELLQPAIEALGEEQHLAPLMANLEAKRAAAHEKVAEALVSSRYRHLLIDLNALGYAGDFGKSGDNRKAADQPLVELASHALSKAHQKLLKRGHGFEKLSKAERHEVRIALKRLRYTLDFFGGVFKSELKKKFVKRLARLQDDLGRMNDVAVAETMLADIVGIAGECESSLKAPPGQLTFAAGGILGWHRRRAAEIDLHLIKDWNSFVRAKPFWLHAPSDS
jgi:triphosphatase